MKIKVKKQSEEKIKSDIYYSEEQQPKEKQGQSLESSFKMRNKTKKQPKQQTKLQALNTNHNRHRSSGNSHNRNPAPPNSTQIKLYPSDMRFIEQIVEKKHGKILTQEEMLSLKKKMVKQTFLQSNPYTEMNFNTGERNEWRDNKKKTLSPEELAKLKKHFLSIMKMVDKGEQGKYTIRDLAREFNLDQSAFLIMKRQFSIDPDVAVFVSKSVVAQERIQQISEIQHITKKKYLLEKIIQKNPLLTKSQLTEKILLITKQSNFFPQHEIQRVLQNQGYVMREIIKYPNSRNFEENLKLKKAFCEKINNLLTQTTHRVYFMGLMNFNTFMFRSEGWSKEFYMIQPQIQQGFSLLTLTEKNSKSIWQFQKHIHKLQVFSKACCQLFKNLMGSNFEPKYVAVDFSLVKYWEVLKKVAKHFHVEIIFIPPFSNQLNPTEFWFEEIKAQMTQSKKFIQESEKSIMNQKEKQNLMKEIHSDLTQIFKQKYRRKDFDFSSYFERAAQYHKKALMLQKF